MQVVQQSSLLYSGSALLHLPVSAGATVMEIP
jgi:hypothetical protein